MIDKYRLTKTQTRNWKTKH